LPLPFKYEFPAKLLYELLHYDPLTGVFTWRGARTGRSRGRAREGQVAGTLGTDTGYWNIGITDDGRKGIYKAHRLAWLYMTGEWPRKQIDHIDMNKLNNAWANLREASPDQNKSNGSSYRSASHKKGAHFQKKTGRWASAIRVMNRTVHLGTFDSEDAAHARYCEEAAKIRGEFARFE